MLVRIALGRCSLSYFYLASFLHCIVFFTPLSIRFISTYLVFPFLRVLAFPRLLPVAIKVFAPHVLGDYLLALHCAVLGAVFSIVYMLFLAW